MRTSHDKLLHVQFRQLHARLVIIPQLLESITSVQCVQQTSYFLTILTVLMSFNRHQMLHVCHSGGEWPWETSNHLLSSLFRQTRPGNGHNPTTSEHEYYCATILMWKKVDCIQWWQSVCGKMIFIMQPTAIICLQVKSLKPQRDSQSMKVGGWVAKTVSRQPVDFTGCGAQKRQDIPGTNKQSAGFLRESRQQTADCTRGRIELKRRRQRNRTDQEFQHGGRSHMSAQFSTHSVCKERTRSISGFCLPSLLSLLVTYTSPSTPLTHTLCCLPSTLQRDVQV